MASRQRAAPRLTSIRSQVRPFPVGWPIGAESKNPAGVLPLAAVGRAHGHFAARNRPQDADDTIVTYWLEYGPKGYYGSKDMRGDRKAGNVRFRGSGLRTAMATAVTGGPATHCAQEADGSFAWDGSRPRPAVFRDQGAGPVRRAAHGRARGRARAAA